MGKIIPRGSLIIWRPHALPEQPFMIEKNLENSGRRPNRSTRSMAAEKKIGKKALGKYAGAVVSDISRPENS